MAEKNYTNVGFKQIYIYRDQILGTGAYGTVYKARCDNLMCAAKILHSTLVQFDQTTVHGRPSQQWPLQRFEQECELMSAIRHPNVVQHLGCHDDSHTRLPVLLMELLNGNLTNYLESSTHDQPIPYHIRVNICHDIILALVFLHSNNIVHRDLSSNNILLTCGLQAKVTDFGMARLSDLNSHPLTTCPGTHVYMPPEAVQDQPVYTEKIDCFSFGVISIQIITRQFPNPGDRHRPIDEHYPAKLTNVTVCEIERRHNHISEIDPRNPILPIALDCLQDNPVERPSAQLLCERFAHLKQSPRYSESATQVEVDNRPQISDHVASLRYIRHVREVIQSYESCLAEKDYTIDSLRHENEQFRQSSRQIEALQQEHSGLQQQIQWLQQQSRERDQLEARKNAEVRHEIMRLRRQLEQSRQETGAKNQRVEALESQIEYQRQKHVQEIHDLQETISSQRRFIDESSTHVSQKNRTIAHKNELIAAKLKEIHLLEQQLHHLKGQSSKDIDDISSQIKLEVEERMRSLSFDRQSSTSMSIDSRVSVLNFSAESNQPASNFQLEWSSENKRAPCGMAAHCNAIVCGKVVYFQPADTNSLYAYNSEIDKWNQLPDLKNSNCSMAIVNNLVTAIGGSKLMTGYSRKLYSLTGKAKGMKWTKLLQPMPTKRSETSALCVKTALIVAGGEGKNGKVLATVEVMNTDTKQWSSASDLPEPLWGASATLCGNVFYIVGGVNVRPIKSVYKCTITSLLQSCQPAFPFTCTTASDSLEQHQLWNRVSDLPVTGPTCVSLYGQLILIGGEDSNSTHTRSAAIHKYDQAIDEWKVISHMSMGRNQCFAAVVPDNLLMIVGGWITTIQDQTASDVVDFAIIEISNVYSQN